ncbi:metal ABC transporter ATP-binding protein [Alicyclobacillus sp. SO9]|uniref:metal ABC transporter ATP-binding protein n=1 Tax=Alicyclobacillus sp. SO9 TaxID=2665646 RepID=UPI0018E8896C|nr:metal ABC transporter ATP-binding protein [Alicyclobacillus sp. SO9]QQE78059.1 metal ABC transporter ATP-binding protein [Alicyclobacillus sp. SO9]
MKTPSELFQEQHRIDKRIVLKATNLSVSMGSDQLLEHLTVEIQAGDFVGLLGPNGAGKTTLLKVFLGLFPPADGDVEVLGQPVHRGHRKIGYVPQKIHLEQDTPLTARDLVGLGLDGHLYGFALPTKRRRDRITEALAAVDALSYQHAAVGQLSGGQQQRLLIAQALVSRPEIMLLDEPLANLDIKSANEIVQLLGRLGKTRNLAIVLVAHDVNPLLGVMNKVLYLARGRGAMGPVNDIIQSEVLSRLYGYDVEVLRVKGRIIVVGGQETKGTVEDLTGCLHCDGQEQTAP